jgi:carbon monoxide dehydrogenase subunit G
MLQLCGEEPFDQPPERVWQSLTDPRFLCECFPGVASVRHADDRSATFEVRPGFSFLRGTLRVSCEFVEKQPPTHARATIRVQGIGSSAELQTQLELAASETGTQVTWSATALELGGLLKAVSQGLLQAAAQKVANDTWARIREKLPS